VKRTVAAMVLLAVAGGFGAFVYQAAARDRNYRRQLAIGDEALRERKTFEAIEAYSGAIVLKPDSTLAYLRRGQAYLQRPDLQQAARDFSTATALDPSATRPLEYLGDVQYRRERFEQAAQSFESRLKLDERSADVTYKLALARYRGGELDKALAALDQTIKLDAERADAHYLRGMCLRDQHQLTQAKDAFERAVALAPASIPPREELADVYGALGRRTDEIEQLQVLAALDREHVERQVAVGLAHARAGHWDVAVLTLGSALERTPNEPLVFRALGEVWLERPRDRNDRVYLSKAKEALERVASSPNATSDVLTVFGRVLLAEGDVDNAERIFQQAVARFPVEASAFLDYASVAERQNHIGAARTALINYDAVIAGGTDRAARAAQIGSLSLRLNDAQAAIEWLQRASEAEPNDLAALTALAGAHLSGGDRTVTGAAITQALELDPQSLLLQAIARSFRAT